MAWIHVLVLRVFVETVLRYGLPLSFVCGLVKVRSHRCLWTDALIWIDLAKTRKEGPGFAQYKLFISGGQCYWPR